MALVTIIRIILSHLINRANWRESFKPITKCIAIAIALITFDSHLKTALKGTIGFCFASQYVARKLVQDI